MEAVIAGLDHAAALAALRPLHLAIGMFDGVHLGHQAVIKAALQSARRAGGAAAVLTFDPHPSRLFRPETPVRLIQDRNRRVAALLELGVRAVVVQPFDQAFAAVEAEAFLPLLRSRLPALHTVYVGENWRFGRGRRGDVALLVGEARKLGLHVVSAPRINGDGEPISSTRIRALLEQGRMDAANVLLGAAYGGEAVVTPGKRLGREIGFPTLNLPWDPDLRPRLGVYVVALRRAGDAGGRSWRAVANFGLRPTVETASTPLLEAHVIEPGCPFAAGDRLRADWLAFIRVEEKFPDVEALRARLALDVAAARAWFGLG